MRFGQSCAKCGDQEPSVATFDLHNFNEKNIYKYVCPRGHESYASHQQDKYEILGDIALDALVDGYDIQAIATFAASLERCYEWFIRVCFAKTYNNNERFKEIWPTVSAQSERQIGMFIATFSQNFIGAPPLLHRSMVELRNKVIHKGYIPSPDEAKKYAQSVFDIVRGLTTIVQTEMQDAMLAELVYRMKDIRDAIPPGSDFNSIYMPMCYFVADQNWVPITSIDRAIENRRWYKAEREKLLRTLREA